MTGTKKQPLTLFPEHLTTQMRALGGKRDELIPGIDNIQFLSFEIGEGSAFSGRNLPDIADIEFAADFDVGDRKKETNKIGSHQGNSGKQADPHQRVNKKRTPAHRGTPLFFSQAFRQEKLPKFDF